MIFSITPQCLFWGLLLVLAQLSNGAKVQFHRRDSASTVSVSASASSIPDNINTYELGNPADPDWIAKLINVTNGLPTSFSNSEILRIDGDVTTDADRLQRLTRLNLLFPGIFWDKAYPDSQPQSCTYEQLNILEMATRVAVRLTHYEPNNLEDVAFQRYFVTDGRTSGQWSNGPNRGHYLNLINNLKQVGSFPSTGDSKGRMLQKRRIAYLCGKIVDERDHCIDSSGNPSSVNAYTVGTGTDGPSEFGTVIIFCPSFFALRFTDMITAGPKKNPVDLNDPDLYTFERTIMHEWMHCRNPIGLTQKVIDLDAGNPSKAVYGSQRCHDRAWLNIPAPNPEVVLNADNYAWTWISREFARVWGWTDDGSTSVDTSGNSSIYSTADIWANLTYPIDPPVNCAGGGASIDCSYIGMSYDDYLLDRGVACDCNGTICSDNSPQCCASSTCSNCAEIKANAKEATDVPSCCTSNTCLWQLGSNVQGPIS